MYQGAKICQAVGGDLNGLTEDFNTILENMEKVDPEPDNGEEEFGGGFVREPGRTSKKLTRWLANAVQQMSSGETHLAEDHMLLGMYHEDFLRAELDRARLRTVISPSVTRQSSMRNSVLPPASSSWPSQSCLWHTSQRTKYTAPPTNVSSMRTTTRMNPATMPVNRMTPRPISSMPASSP